MSKYEFFMAGRWRGKVNIKETVDMIRGNQYSACSFIENTDAAGLEV
jgi:hypothetical protein